MSSIPVVCPTFWECFVLFLVITYGHPVQKEHVKVLKDVSRAAGMLEEDAVHLAQMPAPLQLAWGLAIPARSLLAASQAHCKCFDSLSDCF